MAEPTLSQDQLKEVDTSTLTEDTSVHDSIKSTEPPPLKRSKLAITTQPEKMLIKSYNKDCVCLNNDGAVMCSSNGYILIGTLKKSP